MNVTIIAKAILVLFMRLPLNHPKKEDIFIFGVQVGLESMFMIMKKMKRFLMFY